MFDDVVTRLRPGVRQTRSGDDAPDWTDPDRLETKHVSVQPVSRAELITLGRDASVSTWRLFTAPGVDMDALPTDRIEWNGETLDVDGEQERWPDPVTGAFHHVELLLTRTKG